MKLGQFPIHRRRRFPDWRRQLGNGIPMGLADSIRDGINGSYSWTQKSNDRRRSLLSWYVYSFFSPVQLIIKVRLGSTNLESMMIKWISGAERTLSFPSEYGSVVEKWKFFLAQG